MVHGQFRAKCQICFALVLYYDEISVKAAPCFRLYKINAFIERIKFCLIIE